MGSNSPYKAISPTRYKYILSEFSNKAEELAKVLANKRFSKCDACGNWDFLLVHHWYQQEPDQWGHRKVYTKELCNKCNSLLPSGNRDHILPSWEEQLAQLWKPNGHLDKSKRQNDIRFWETELKSETDPDSRQDIRQLLDSLRFGIRR